MSRLPSFTTLILLAIHSQALPLADEQDEYECWYDEPAIAHGQQPVQHVAAQHVVGSTAPLATIPNPPPASILAPYEQKPTFPPPSPSPSTSPHASSSQIPHATLPSPAHSNTLATVGTVSGILFAVIVLSVAARYFVHRRRLSSADPFSDPPKPRRGFVAFFLKFSRSASSKKRLSDESWVSPRLPTRSTTPSLNVSVPSPSLLPHDLELRSYAFPARKRKLVPVTTPACTPSDTEFGSRLELDHTKDSCRSIQHTPIRIPSIRVPSPAYISPFSPSPSIGSNTSIVSAAPSTDSLPFALASTNEPPHREGARLSRLLSSSFQAPRTRSRPRADPDTNVSTATFVRTTTAQLIETARTYAHAYRPSSSTSNSLYTPPASNSSLRLAGARSRADFYPNNTNGDSRTTSVASINSNAAIRISPSFTASPAAHSTTYSPWRRARDTLSTVTTSDTVSTVPHLLRAASEMQIPISSSISSAAMSPFADPPPLRAQPRSESVMPSASSSSLGTIGSGTGWSVTGRQAQTGTPLGLKVRLSDASEHEHYRARERERQVRRNHERGRQALEDVFSAESSSETNPLMARRDELDEPDRGASPTPTRKVARAGAYRRSQSLTWLNLRRGKKEVWRRASDENLEISGTPSQVRPNSDDLESLMHGRTKSEPESIHAGDEINIDDSVFVRGSRTSDKRRTRFEFKLRDSESVLREIGW